MSRRRPERVPCVECRRPTPSPTRVCVSCRREIYLAPSPDRPTVEAMAARMEAVERAMRAIRLDPNRATGGEADEALRRAGLLERREEVIRRHLPPESGVSSDGPRASGRGAGWSRARHASGRPNELMGAMR